MGLVPSDTRSVDIIASTHVIMDEAAATPGAQVDVMARDGKCGGTRSAAVGPEGRVGGSVGGHLGGRRSGRRSERRSGRRSGHLGRHLGGRGGHGRALVGGERSIAAPLTHQ
jgi:hypothetical protein